MSIVLSKNDPEVIKAEKKLPIIFGGWSYRQTTLRHGGWSHMFIKVGILGQTTNLAHPDERWVKATEGWEPK